MFSHETFSHETFSHETFGHETFSHEMRGHETCGHEFRKTRPLSSAVAVVAILFLSACTVAVQKGSNGQNKNVNIQTPVGGILVSKGADVADTGLSVYPGARLMPEVNGDDNKSANVRISGFGFGFKVVALQFESNDAPGKVIAFYKDQLKKYGDVLECHSSGHFNTDMKYSDKAGQSHALTCDGDSGKNVELEAGTDENQHIVAVEPEGKGSTFSLVYVRAHGKEADI
ncbi:MAG TPA: hypothetical protein VIW68_13880 [Candidatus Sulfotelmatobacter sp.]